MDNDLRAIAYRPDGSHIVRYIEPPQSRTDLSNWLDQQVIDNYYTGGHLEEYVDGIGWVLDTWNEENADSDESYVD